MDWIKIAGGIVLVVIIIIILMTAFRKSPKAYYKRAEKAHQNAEKYHDLGDEELAKEYLEEAELYRKKAEEMTNAMV